MSEPANPDFNDEPPPYAPGESGPEPGPDMPVLPVRPTGEQAKRPGSDLVVVCSAMVGTLLLAVMITVCMGGNPGVLVLLFGMICFVIFHYMLWGWWLGKWIQRRVEKEEHK
ncbi:MAG: hypothetical protein N2C12_10550 [Planctomycetales bacterium]